MLSTFNVKAVLYETKYTDFFKFFSLANNSKSKLMGLS